MRTNAAGLGIIKQCEGLRLESYKCPAGVWTIGYGHTQDVKPGQRITAHQAEVILESDLELKYEPGVAALAQGANENEFSALVSFAYNLGIAALARSKLLKKFLAGDKAGAAEEFASWRIAGGKVLPGLVKRRALERDLFLREP